MNKKIIFFSMVGLMILVSIFYINQNKKEDIENNELLEKYPKLSLIDSLNITESKENAAKLFINKENILTKNNKTLNFKEEKFYCENKVAEEILYKKYSRQGYIGNWYSISVIDCQEYYWIYENSDSGLEIFGPF